MNPKYQANPKHNPLTNDGNLNIELPAIPPPNLKKKISYKQKEKIYLCLWQAQIVIDRFYKDSKLASEFFLNNEGMNAGGAFTDAAQPMAQDFGVYESTLRTLKSTIKSLQ